MLSAIVNRFVGSNELDKYVKIKRIGNGANGDVYLCEKDGKEYARKEIYLYTYENEKPDPDSEGEYKLKDKLKSQLLNVVHYEFGGYDKDNNEVVIISELVDGIDLERLIYSDVKISIPQIKWIVAQLLTGLRSLNSVDIVHFDIKPSNAMITYDYKVKIIDFGTAHSVGDVVNEINATPNYHNRDVRELSDSEDQKRITDEMKKYDLWCVGCILYELYNREFLFRSLNYNDHIAKLSDFEQNLRDGNHDFFNINDNTDDEKQMNDFFKFIMQPTLKDMPSLGQVLEHKWIKDYVHVNIKINSNESF